MVIGLTLDYKKYYKLIKHHFPFISLAQKLASNVITSHLPIPLHSER